MASGIVELVVRRPAGRCTGGIIGTVRIHFDMWGSAVVGAVRARRRRLEGAKVLVAARRRAEAVRHPRSVVVVEQGAALDVGDTSKMQPLHHACAHGRAATVDLLLEWRAQLVAGDLEGRSPLHLACRAHAIDVARRRVHRLQQQLACAVRWATQMRLDLGLSLIHI